MKQVKCQTNRARRALAAGALCWIVWMSVVSTQATPTVEVGNASGAPGSTILLPVVIRGGSSVVAAQWDVLYSSGNLVAQAAVLGDALASFTVASHEIRPGVQRMVLYSRTGAALPDPAQLSIPFVISQNAPAASIPVSMTNVILADEGARALAAVTLAAGSVSISTTTTTPVRFQSLQLSLDGLLHLQVTGATGKSLILQTSPDLRLWSVLSTNAAVGGVVEVADRVTLPQLFYRAVLVR